MTKLDQYSEFGSVVNKLKGYDSAVVPCETAELRNSPKVGRMNAKEGLIDNIDEEKVIIMANAKNSIELKRGTQAPKIIDPSSK